jgi:hypothetical protein
MALDLDDDLYEVKGAFDYVRESDGKSFTYTHWYVAVKNGEVLGAEGYTGSRDLLNMSLEEMSDMYKTLIEDKWVEHRKWLERQFEIDFEEWVRLIHEAPPKPDKCRWHEEDLDYEEEINLALSTTNTVSEALTRAQTKARLTMRAWPDCQGDPLEIAVRFHPQEDKLTFFWNCPRHEDGK